MVNNIYATANKICFTGDFDKSSVTVKIYTASNEKTLVRELTVAVNNNTFEVNRFETGVDGIFYCYETDFGGVSFVSEIEDNNINCAAFPEVATKKGLMTVYPWLYDELSFKHVSFNISISSLFRAAQSNTTEVYNYNGYTYFIDKEYLSRVDEWIKGFSDKGIIVYLILLATTRWEGAEVDEELRDILIHPYNGYFQIVSPFNVTTDIGLRYYEAFCNFVSQRWVKDTGHGKVSAFIVGNEVQSSFIWQPDDIDMSCEKFADEYSRALRIAHLAGAKEFKNIRTYISLDHFWGSSHVNDAPTKSYTGLDLLNNIISVARNKGNFYFCFAPHPYSEDLYNCEFWEEKNITAVENVSCLTFKNLELISEYVNKEENLYNGKARRVILSEQGFASNNTEDSEELQKEAFGRAYRKVMEIPEIDAFIYHSDYDWLDEAINLGLMRCPDVPSNDDYRKPIYYLFQTIDQESNGNKVWESFEHVDPNA